MDGTASDAPLAASLPGNALDRAVLVPALALAALVIVLSATASLRVPLHSVVTPVAGFFAVGLAVQGWRWLRGPLARPLALLGLLAALAAWLVLAEYAGKWLPTPADLLGPQPDSWSYQAFADYLDHYPRGRTSGMPMVDEFGAHLGEARFAASALLAFLHDLPVLADVPTTRLTFCLLCLGVYFFSMLALGRAYIGYAGWPLPLLAAFLATAGGWLGRLVMAANYDNLIFAALTPALLALCCGPRTSSDGPVVRWRVAAAIALLSGAMLYNYPEGLALLGILCLPLVVALVGFGSKGRRHERWMEIGVGGLLGVGLALPYLPTFGAYLHNQMTLGLKVGPVLRPYEGLLPGLLGGSRLAAAFALGDELQTIPVRLVSNLLPLGLLALMIPGVGLIARRQRWFPWVALPLTILCLWQNVGKHYDYGTFKVLLAANWWIYPAIAAGVFRIAERGRFSTAATAILTGVLLLSIGAVKRDNRLRLPTITLTDRVKPLQELSTLRFVTGQSPVLLSLDDGFDHLWATYYLRGLPLSARLQKSYLAMPHIAPYLASGVFPPPESCPFLLVAGHRPNALWQNSRFSLVPATAVYLEELENPTNGLETIGGQRFLWVGTQPATFRFFVLRGGRYALSAARFELGPSLGGKPAAHVAVTDADGTHSVEIITGTSSLPIALAAGDNAVVLRCLDTPVPLTPGGDQRELMLGILAPDVAANPAP